VPGLGTSYGRGGATTAQWDLVNSDVILIQGSNMAECHPIAFRFVMEARERGATVIHVDPRFTRTSANADIYAPIRPGTDIAFLGGLINYVIEHEKYFADYVRAYTNGPYLINKDFRDTEDLDGLFSGFDEGGNAYTPDTWTYEGEEPSPAAEHNRARTGETFADRAVRSSGKPIPRDDTMRDPRCVFQILKRHFARYTPELVEEICGTPRDVFLRVAEALCANSGQPDKTGCVCYALGWTQHTVGVQNIRAAAILQLLLGNIGRPGGGILALRGHAAIQGSTDVPTLFNLLPGYIPMPLAHHTTVDDFMAANTAITGWWHNMPKYVVSLLKAWYGEHATKDNEWAYQYLPKIHSEDDYSYYPTMMDMQNGKVKGLFVMGENFAVGGPGSLVERAGLRKLQWCVVRDPFLVETAQFWQLDDVDPKDVETEVIYMPAAWAAEKDGSLTNTQRMLQWHDRAVDPPGDARSESWFMYHLGRRIRALYQGSTEERDQPLLRLTWDYPVEGAHQEPKADAVLREINGWTVADNTVVSGYSELKDDGSTACGCWIYSGVMPEEGRNLARARERDKPGEHTNNRNWGFAWPANRRILYNRASAAPDGQPWSERKRLVWWDAAANGGKGQWAGDDVADFEKDKPPTFRPKDDAVGMEALSGAQPFIIHAEGVARLFAPFGLKDGPLPAHYEPVESPVPNQLYPRRPYNPVAYLYGDEPNNQYNPPESPEYPYVITTYRLTEHHTSGAMSRWSPWLSELQPELFAEIDPVLADQKGIQTGDWVTISTARASIEARAMVTDRMRPLRIKGREVHVIGLPYHWGQKGIVTGDVVNDLIGIMLEPNVRIHEAKAFTCALRKGRKRADQPREEESPGRGVGVEGGVGERAGGERASGEGGGGEGGGGEGTEMAGRIPPARA
jgi:formate dehydrogenase major subunit